MALTPGGLVAHAAALRSFPSSLLLIFLPPALPLLDRQYGSPLSTRVLTQARDTFFAAPAGSESPPCASVDTPLIHLSFFRPDRYHCTLQYGGLLVPFAGEHGAPGSLEAAVVDRHTHCAAVLAVQLQLQLHTEQCDRVADRVSRLADLDATHLR